jgi:amidophosphoribosyltransferase
MSDFIGHECGMAFIRLLKPLAYFQDKYKTSLYGFNKLFLLMEKQHNRGQDGVGIGCQKLGMPLGQPYLYRRRSTRKDSLSYVIKQEQKAFDDLCNRNIIDPHDPNSVKSHFDFGGELLIGHLRYGTSGAFSESSCHPFARRSNWPTKTLMVCGNFNMTNAAQLVDGLINRGQHPVFSTDTQTVLEEIGFHLDEEHTDLYRKLRDSGMEGRDIPAEISQQIDISKIIRISAEIWDGGYVIVGAVGNGDGFILRDPNGIRPCSYYKSDELIAFASERVALMTAFDTDQDQVHELEPGTVAVIKANGDTSFTRFAEPRKPTPCSFERIYFSRGNDPDIYRERKALGEALVPQILDSIDHDTTNIVASFVPNTAEVAYYGMMDGLRKHRRKIVKKQLLEAIEAGTADEAMLDELILRNWPRDEKIAQKDIKLRTFISQEKGRNQLVSHVYDITYGVVHSKDNLVVIDDSIVRGTTLRQSILKILARTNPKKIVIVSTAPQIRYPDCYGIDMSELGKFIAFQAAINLLKRRGDFATIKDIYESCLVELTKPIGEMVNCVQRIYAPFSDEEISAEVSRIVRPRTAWQGEVQVMFLTVERLKAALPENSGVWYFTGDYPTPGGYNVVNQAFVHYYEKRDGRAYDLPL